MKGVPAIGADNPLRALGATYARQALAKLRVEATKWLAKHRRPDDIEVRPGVFRHTASEHRRADYWLCQDCHLPDPMAFMVEDDVWQAARLSQGVICIPCLETRLGRKLVIQDFQHVPMNDALFTGYLLGIIQ